MTLAANRSFPFGGNWRRVVVAAGLAAMAVTALGQVPAPAAPAAAPSAANPIRIGLIFPLTGGSAAPGNSARIGAQLAVSEINALGGYLGRPLELVIRDDKANNDEGLKHAEELVIKEKVAFTIGFCNTGVAMRALDVFQNNKHVLVVPCATGTAITAKVPPAESYVFRVSPPDRIQAPFVVSEVVDKRKFTKVALFADTTGYGDGGFKDVSDDLARRGLTPVYTHRFATDVKSLVDEVKAAQAAGAQAIISYTVGVPQGVLARSRAQAGVKIPMFAPWPLSWRGALETAGAADLEGTMMVQTIIQDNLNERRSSFLARYFKASDEKGIGSLMAAAQTYDAVNLMLRVLFQTKGNTSGPVLKQALENLDRPYQGVVTVYDKPFSSTDHDAMAPNMLWLGVWRKGEIQYFYPEDAKRAGFVRRKEAAPPAKQ
jgi:branched-chain amino acid transport system substrate-binding protein